MSSETNNSYNNNENNNYVPSSYSQYPTEENKYECQKGPFEGFFVATPEFCKLRLPTPGSQEQPGPQGPQGETGPQGEIGQTGATGAQGPLGPQGPPGPAGGQPGPQGPQGPAGMPGPQGERGLTGATGMQGPLGEDGMDGAQGARGFNGTQGPQGEPGINGINGTQGPPGPLQIPSSKLYIVNGPLLVADPFPPQDSLTSNAECMDGDIVVSGGYSIQDSSGNLNPFVRMGGLITQPFANFSGWSTNILAFSGVTVSTIGLCFDNTS